MSDDFEQFPISVGVQGVFVGIKFNEPRDFLLMDKTTALKLGQALISVANEITTQ